MRLFRRRDAVRPQLVIHIGVHKTGTSALQAMLARNRIALAHRGVWYEPWSDTSNHSGIAAAFVQGKPEPGIIAVRALLEAAQRKHCRCALVSSEVFSEGIVDGPAIRAAVADTPTTVIAYIRRPDQMLVSAYDQLVREARWTTRIEERRPYDPTYVTILKNWMGETPWRLVIAPYDPPQWTGGRLETDFLAMIGVDAQGLDFGPPDDRPNRSLPPPYTEILRRANGLAIGNSDRETFIAALFALAAAHPEAYAASSLPADEAADYFRKLEGKLPVLRPYFRPGFDEAFLRADRSIAASASLPA